jgi:hypothetical protein
VNTPKAIPSCVVICARNSFQKMSRLPRRDCSSLFHLPKEGTRPTWPYAHRDGDLNQYFIVRVAYEICRLDSKFRCEDPSLPGVNTDRHAPPRNGDR